MVVDFGTATTFDAISARGEYLGGAICPGRGHLDGGPLPQRLQAAEGGVLRPPHVIGRNTIHLHPGPDRPTGYVGLVDGICTRMAEELGGAPKVVATGGLATLIAGISKTISEVDEHHAPGVCASSTSATDERDAAVDRHGELQRSRRPLGPGGRAFVLRGAGPLVAPRASSAAPTTGTTGTPAHVLVRGDPGPGGEELQPGRAAVRSGLAAWRDEPGAAASPGPGPPRAAPARPGGAGGGPGLQLWPEDPQLLSARAALGNRQDPVLPSSPATTGSTSHSGSPPAQMAQAPRPGSGALPGHAGRLRRLAPPPGANMPIAPCRSTPFPSLCRSTPTASRPPRCAVMGAEGARAGRARPLDLVTLLFVLSFD